MRGRDADDKWFSLVYLFLFLFLKFLKNREAWHQLLFLHVTSAAGLSHVFARNAFWWHTFHRIKIARMNHSVLIGRFYVMFKTRTALFNQGQKLEKFECELEAQEFLELTKHELWVFKNSSSIIFFLIKSCFLTWIVMVFSYLQINKNTPLEPKGPCASVINSSHSTGQYGYWISMTFFNVTY